LIKKIQHPQEFFFLESILILKRKKIEIFFQRGIEEIEVHIIKYGSYLVGLKKDGIKKRILFSDNFFYIYLKIKMREFFLTLPSRSSLGVTLIELASE
jgi:hypothetical protein